MFSAAEQPALKYKDLQNDDTAIYNKDQDEKIVMLNQPKRTWVAHTNTEAKSIVDIQDVEMNKAYTHKAQGVNPYQHIAALKERRKTKKKIRKIARRKVLKLKRMPAKRYKIKGLLGSKIKVSPTITKIATQKNTTKDKSSIQGISKNRKESKQEKG